MSTETGPGDAAGATGLGEDAGEGSVVDPGTLLGRLAAAGIDLDRARQWLADGAVSVAGEVVTNPDHPAPPGTRWMINPP